MDDVVPHNEVVEARAGTGFFGSGGSGWRPRELAFGPYKQQKAENLPDKCVQKPLVVRLTKGIAETYNLCNPQFQYSEELNPKRFLTSPSVGVLNDGHDNAKSDLILMVNLELVNQDTQRRYIVKDVLGQGTFGQVAKCWVPEINGHAAVKIIKNQPAYYQQALVEVSILTALNKKYDPEDKHHIVRIYDHFVYQRHLCISFEMLDTNLYELIKLNHFRGFSLSIVQLFSKQILRGLVLLKEAGIIHCDLKPENILLCTSMTPAGVKIIDFGSACMEDRTVYSYIQSRYYRSPEVLLGYQYTTGIDMWSFGCIVAELFLGLPLFPGASEFDLLKRMIEILGGEPPDYILEAAKNTSKFFKRVGSVHTIENGEFSEDRKSAYQVLTLEEYEAREMKKPAIGKEYFGHKDLETLVTNYPYKKTLTEEDILKESRIRLALIDFLRGLVEFDPAKRWSPFQASRHPFLTGEPFNCPFKPPPETPRMPVTQNFKVKHHPGGGHWFAAGLSPNISGRRYSLHNSPQFQMLPYGNATSYGSIGSHGSYNDNYGIGSSYGSYGDNSPFTYFSPAGPSGINIRMQGNASYLGNSPDARRRIMQYPHGNGLGMSPSAGNLAPLPLGTSPSQFTPPGSYGQFPVGSPGHYGPTSPARSSCHGSPLGKVPAGSQNSRRKSWGYGGSSRSNEGSSLHWQGQCGEGTSPRQRDGNYQVHSGSPSTSQSSISALGRKPPHGGSGIPLSPSTNQTMLSSFTPGSNSHFSQAMGAGHYKPDASLSLPDPGDWDPNYSDDQLLQDECSDMSSLSSEFSKEMQIGPAESSNSRRYNNYPSTSSSLAVPRSNGQHVKGYSDVDMGSPSAHDPQTAYVHPMSKPSYFMPHMHQNSPSRFGQQPTQRFYHGRSQPLHGNEWSHVNVQPPIPSFHSGGSHSPGNSSFQNGMPWGRNADHPITSIPPTSRGRKGYERIL